MEKQVPEEKINQYVKGYQEKYPIPKRGPKTPEGIAKAAQNLLRKSTQTHKKGTRCSFELKLDSIAKDPCYAKNQQVYFSKRYKELKLMLPKQIHNQFEGILHFLALQEIKLMDYYRILNDEKLNHSEINKTMVLLDKGINNYNRLFTLLNLNKGLINEELFKENEQLKQNYKDSEEGQNKLLWEKICLENELKQLKEKIT